MEERRRQPQNKSKKEQILDQFSEFTKSLVQENGRVPNELVSSAKSKLEYFEILKSEVEFHLNLAQEELDRVIGIIQNHIHNDFNPDGFFLQKERDYLKCLKLQYV